MGGCNSAVGCSGVGGCSAGGVDEWSIVEWVGGVVVWVSVAL